MAVLKWTLIIITAIGAPLLLTATGRGANAGTCWISSEGEVCSDGSFTVTDKHGRHRQYGIRNGGFERYPGQSWRPVYERRDER